MDRELGKRIIALRNAIVADFNRGHWTEVGLLSETTDLINDHPRLLRSLDFRDEDYDGNVLNVLKEIVERDPRAFREIEQYVAENFHGDSEYISSTPAARRITFSPNVFSVPDVLPEPDLVAVMMPFSAEFAAAFRSIRSACEAAGLRCMRVDDMWEESAIIQDIFNLIFRAQVVVVDFTGKNPNVMYETGIAHTLGKHVVPISQAMSDVPFDLTHHRVLKYFPNRQGISELEAKLTERLTYLNSTM